MTALSVGATLVVVERDWLFQSFAAVLRSCRVTHVMTTPAVWSLVDADPCTFPALRAVMLGGEPTPDGLISTWAPHVRLFNVYGTTEATVYQLSHEHTLLQDSGVPKAKCIGTAMDGVEAFLVPLCSSMQHDNCKGPRGAQPRQQEKEGQEKGDEEDDMEDEEEKGKQQQQQQQQQDRTKRGILVVAGKQLGRYLPDLHKQAESVCQQGKQEEGEAGPERTCDGSCCTSALPPLPPLPSCLQDDGSSGFYLHKGRVVYATGDVVEEVVTDGRCSAEPASLAFVGRTDDQVKLNGQRVSLLDVDATCGLCPLVHTCKCVLSNNQVQWYNFVLSSFFPSSLLLHSPLCPFLVPPCLRVQTCSAFDAPATASRGHSTSTPATPARDAAAVC